jgi:hypothetical protein
MTINAAILTDQATIQRDYRTELKRFVDAFNALQLTAKPVIFATQDEVNAGAASDRIVAPNTLAVRLGQMLTPDAVSKGASDAGRAPRLNVRGVLDRSFVELPIASAADITAGTDNSLAVSPKGLADLFTPTSTSRGVADGGRAPRLTAAGLIDPSFLPSTSRTYRGTFDATKPGGGQATPVQDGNWAQGDYFIATAAGTYDFATGQPSPTGTAVAQHDMVISNGTGWDVLSNPSPTTGFLPIDGSAAMGGNLTFAPGAGGAAQFGVENALLDMGTY